MKRIVLLLALAGSAAHAQRLPEPEQFIERSVVVLPDVVDHYALAETEYDPDRQFAGVTSKWIVQGAPRDLRFTVFVYPVAPTDEQTAVIREIDDVVLQLQQMVEVGSYSRMVPGERAMFEVDAPVASLFDPLPDGIEAGLLPSGVFDDESGAAEAFAIAMRRAQPPATSRGVRQRFHIEGEGTAMRSLAYVFYRQLYAVKVRVSTPADSMDDTTFEALADKATRTLLPRIRVENFGTCGVPRFASPASGTERRDPSAAVRQMMIAATLLKLSNCRTRPHLAYVAPSRGETPVEIIHPPGAWMRRDPG